MIWKKLLLYFLTTFLHENFLFLDFDRVLFSDFSLMWCWWCSISHLYLIIDDQGAIIVDGSHTPNNNNYFQNRQRCKISRWQNCDEEGIEDQLEDCKYSKYCPVFEPIYWDIKFLPGNWFYWIKCRINKGDEQLQTW